MRIRGTDGLDDEVLIRAGYRYGSAVLAPIRQNAEFQQGGLKDEERLDLGGDRQTRQLLRLNVREDVHVFLLTARPGRIENDVEGAALARLVLALYEGRGGAPATGSGSRTTLRRRSPSGAREW